MNYELLSYLLKASLVLAILTLAYAWLVKRETFVQVNRWLLWMNVAATVLLPIVPVPDFEWMPDAPAKVVAEVIPAVPPKAELTPIAEKAAAVPVPVTVAAEAVQTTSSLSVWDWIGRVYALVMTVLTIKLLIQLFSLWRLKSGGTTYATDEGVRLVESDKITSPFSFFHWIFYNPTQHNDDEWQQVWAHECVHAQQRHSLDMLTAEVLKIVFWFNPFAWWHQRLVQETLEFITDRAVLDSGVEKKSYQYHLLRSTLSADNESFTNHFNKSLLKNRIAMMNKAKSSWKALGKYGVFIGMLWVCAAFTKPYRAEVKTKILLLGEVLETPVSRLSPLKDFVLETKSEPSSKTKYVHFKEGKLYWVITPKVTLKDLSMIQSEFEKVGCTFTVKQLKLNALGYYISEIKVGTSLPNGGGRSSTDLIKSVNKPFDSFGGWLSVKDASCGISDISYDTLFKKVVQKDQHLLDEWLKKHEKEHIKANNAEAYDDQTQNFRRNFYKSPLRVHNGLKELQQEELQFLAESGARNGVYFKDGNLRLDPFYITAELFVDDKKSDLVQIQQLEVKDISAILISAIYTDSSRKHFTRTVAIFTKNNQQLP